MEMGGGNGNGKTRADSAECSTVIDHLHSSQRKREREGRTNGRNMGEQIRQKNYFVGYSPETGILQRVVSYLTEPDYLGGNYFKLPPTRCFLIWRKTNVPEKFSMAMCEYAWTSFNDNAKMFSFSAVGQEGRFHPTQKPPELYRWILENYSKPTDIILDTHVGSASSLIACRETGHKYVGFEIDPDYYAMAKKRLDAAEAQGNIFDFL